MKTIILFLLLLSTSAAMAIRPEREYRFTPDMRGLKYTEYQITTPDNYKINVWEYAMPDSVKTMRTVIIAGSDAGNMGYSIWHAYALLRQGIRVITFDYRGFGKSSDFTFNKDFLFHHEYAVDLDSVIESIREKYPSNSIGVFGFSMGTYISLIKKQKTDFLIAEGFYNDPITVVERIKERKDETVLLPPRTQTVKRVKNPVLIFCADTDKTTTTADAREFDKKNTVTMVVFAGQHLAGIGVLTRKTIGDEYGEKISDFISANKL